MTRKIAFSGSRDFNGVLPIIQVLKRLGEDGLFTVTVGDANYGLDANLRLLLESSRYDGLESWTVEICHWPMRSSSTKQERWAAAHERNGRVVRGAEVLFAFYGKDGPTPGTTDAINWAKELEIEYHVYHAHLRTWGP